jgi:O-antigen ligase
MKHSIAWPRPRWGWHWIVLLPASLTLAWMARLVAADPRWLVIAAAPLLYLGLLIASLRRPLVFVAIFLAALMLLPPLYLRSLGDSPFYVSTLLVPIGLLILLSRPLELGSRLNSVGAGLAFLLLGTGLSLPFSFWLSGTTVGAQSLCRWLMLVQMALVYAIIRAHRDVQGAERVFPWLMGTAVVSAAYGAFDFFWPVPLPHPAADQFIWLEHAVVRRAQGVFYESCNFGNFCGLFLVIAAAALLSGREHVLRIRREWLVLFVAILTPAVVLAFSRSVWVSILISLLAFAAVSPHAKVKRAATLVLALGLPLVALWLYVPQIWGYVVGVRLADLSQIFSDPNFASSGRWDVWRRVSELLQDNPQYLLFGIGYKTLPYTRLFRGEIIADNGYLSLLLETGILGLGGFLLFSRSVLATFFKLVRRRRDAVAFWAGVLFAFWCGECIQMLAADAYTYWRTMVVLTALMAFTLNASEVDPPASFAPISTEKLG